MNFKPFAIAFSILLATGQSQALETAAPARKDVTFHDVMDPASGMVSQRLPLPKGWRIDKDPNNEVEMVGPDNIIVYKVEPEAYAYSNDQFTQNSIRMMGQQIHPVISLKEYMNRYLVPEYGNLGHLIKSYPIPEIANKFETIAKLTPKIDVQRRTVNALGTEWEMKDGRRACVVLIQLVSQFRNLDHWVVLSSELVAPRERFEYARDAIIYALANVEVNPKFVIYSNNKLLADHRRRNEAMKQSQRAHLQRMNAIAARGRASASIAKTYSDISDINHAGYLKRNDMVNTGHSKAIDSIGDRSVITNSDTNEHYRVNSGSSYYWVNNNGEYIGTDNSLFDPRTQQGLSNQDWKQFEVAK